MNQPIRFQDDCGFLYTRGDELGQGGQGAVYKTPEEDYAIKTLSRALNESFQQTKERAAEFVKRIRLLPIPEGIRMAQPVSLLWTQSGTKAPDEVGYLMRYFSGRSSFQEHYFKGIQNAKPIDALPAEIRPFLSRYVAQGSSRSRALALADLACTLTRLHGAGIVYGDLSPANVLIGDFSDGFGRTCLIDPDNLRMEGERDGAACAVFTPHYGAPEKQSGNATPNWTEDAWSFAVLAFRVLTGGCWPFRVSERDWDSDEEDVVQYESSRAILDQLAVFQRHLFSDAVFRLFLRMFEDGLNHPRRRPPLLVWAVLLAKSADAMIDCPTCRMSFFPDRNSHCPWCGGDAARYAALETNRWRWILQPHPASSKNDIYPIPSRLFKPFSPNSWCEIEFQVRCSFDKREWEPTRRNPSPEGLSWKWMPEEGDGHEEEGDGHESV